MWGNKDRVGMMCISADTIMCWVSRRSKRAKVPETL